MKSIVYLLIAVFISSILISAFPKCGLTHKQTITILCADDSCPPDMLKISGAVIKSRLTDYGLQDVRVTADEVASGLNISFDNRSGLKIPVALLISKGKVEFHEVYDRSDAIIDLSELRKLTSVLNIPENDETGRFSGILGYCKEEKKPEVELYLWNHRVCKAGYEISYCWSETPDKNGDYYLYLVSYQPLLNNAHIKECDVISNTSDKKPELMISFDESGKSIWKDITVRNIGRPIAIVLDGKVLQAPVVRSEITDGKCLITGDFSADEVNLINSLMKNKELPFNFKFKN